MKKKYNSRKRIMVAYILRIITFVMLAVMISLIACGGIYIYDLFHKEEEKQVIHTYVSKSEPKEKPYDVKQDAPIKEEKTDDALKEKGNDDTYKGIRIVLDAGHGGNDGGTYSGDIVEKDITLAVVKQMQRLLEELWIEIVLTRDSDEYMSLEERTEVENQSDADLFVSIHCNFYDEDSSIHGLECYYYEKSEEGKILAEQMIASLKERNQLTVRSAKEDSFYVLKNTKKTALLVEIGFLSNKNECRKLASEEYQKLLAEELVKSLEEIISSGLF